MSVSSEPARSTRTASEAPAWTSGSASRRSIRSSTSMPTTLPRRSPRSSSSSRPVVPSRIRSRTRQLFSHEIAWSFPNRRHPAATSLVAGGAFVVGEAASVVVGEQDQGDELERLVACAGQCVVRVVVDADPIAGSRFDRLAVVAAEADGRPSRDLDAAEASTSKHLLRLEQRGDRHRPLALLHALVDGHHHLVCPAVDHRGSSLVSSSLTRSFRAPTTACPGTTSGDSAGLTGTAGYGHEFF